MDIIYIYKYTNNFNGHAYIGKTNNIERRRREHKSNAYNKYNSFYYSLWCQKIRQYGYENFSFEILEEANTSNWAERERYWIAFYNTFKGAGYNSTEGGDKDYDREKKLTDAQVDEIVELLQTSDEPQFIIAAEYDISVALLSNINTGLKYKKDYIKYPIRKRYKDFDEYSDLIKDIVETKIPLTQLAEKYDFSYSTVKKINEGRMHKQEHWSYPLRVSANKQITEQEYQKIVSLLETTDIPIYKIGEMLGRSKQAISAINNGNTHYNSSKTYPLRKPVSTIPEA